MLTELQISTLVARYARERDRFEKMASTASRHLSAALHDAAVPHVPTFRAKSPESFRGKLERNLKKFEFKSFEQEFGPSILDLAGVRTLLYRPADASVVCKIIEDRFVVPEGDRFRRHHDNQDGYQAHHRVVRLSADMLAADPRLANLDDVFCEIQVVTLGDHIWNELEHDIKYKTPDGLPSELQKGLLRNLRSQLNATRDTVAQLMEETARRRQENLSQIETPEDLQYSLRACSGRVLRGDLARLLELLEKSLRTVTPAELQRLKLGAEDLEAAKEQLETAGLSVDEDDPVLVVAALWDDLGPEFQKIVTSWPGKPGPVSRAVRALAELREAT